ncbi:hypothetical protein TELCIR_21682, partial [Teladorsagia circumcincta]
VEKGSAEKLSSEEVGRTPEGDLSKTPIAKPSAEGSKEDAKKVESRGVSEEKKSSAEKVELEKEKKSDDARLASKEGVKFNKLSPKPSKPAEENVDKEKGTSKEEIKDSKEEVKGSKEEVKEGEEKEGAPEKDSKLSDEIASLGENEAQEK